LPEKGKHCYLESYTTLFLCIYRYAYVDASLSAPLKYVINSGLKRAVITYDIACQYSVNFFTRIKEYQPPLFTNEELALLSQKNPEIQWAVNTYHLGFHVEECADNFSLRHTNSVGRTCGEIVESNWSSLDRIAVSTREMGFGHRIDTLNDVMADWTWRKNSSFSLFSFMLHVLNLQIISIFTGKKLLRSHKQAVEQIQVQTKEFNTFTSTLFPEKLTQLEKEMDSRGGEQYRMKKIELPSLSKCERALEAREKEKLSALAPKPVRSRSSPVAILSKGLQVEIKVYFLFSFPISNFDFDF
jgi:hypothetical protein